MCKEEHICKFCKKSFYDWKSRHRIYCSMRCGKLGKSSWNKNMSWSDEVKEKLSISHLGKLNPHIGVPRSKETREKISIAMTGHIKSLETRKKHSINMIHKMRNNIICSEDTLPERLFEKQLLYNNILYVKQFKYDLGIADFWLPENNIIVEVDGIYWHSKPEVIERDKRQNDYFEENEYTLFRFTDKEILKDINGCIKQLE